MEVVIRDELFLVFQRHEKRIIKCVPFHAIRNMPANRKAECVLVDLSFRILDIPIPAA